MKNRVLISVLMAAHLLMMQGCVGLVIGTYGKHEQDLEYLWGNIVITNERGSGSTRQEVLRQHGEPDKAYEYGNCDVLVYPGGISWAGAGAFTLLFPVPLLVPTGRYETRVYIRDGEVSQVIREHGDVGWMFGGYCGSNSCHFVPGKSPPWMSGPREAQVRC